MKKQKSPEPRPSQQPFFTRFLEDQELSKVSAGKPDQTMKYPSDGDEW